MESVWIKDGKHFCGDNLQNISVCATGNWQTLLLALMREESQRFTSISPLMTTPICDWHLKRIGHVILRKLIQASIWGFSGNCHLYSMHDLLRSFYIEQTVTSRYHWMLTCWLWGGRSGLIVIYDGRVFKTNLFWILSLKNDAKSLLLLTDWNSGANWV